MSYITVIVKKNACIFFLSFTILELTPRSWDMPLLGGGGGGTSIYKKGGLLIRNVENSLRYHDPVCRRGSKFFHPL